jgi:hypothetical protein
MRQILFVALFTVILMPALAFGQEPSRVNDQEMRKVWADVHSDVGKFRSAMGKDIREVTIAGVRYFPQAMLRDLDLWSRKLKNDFSRGIERDSDVEVFLKQAAGFEAIVKVAATRPDVKFSWQDLRQDLDKVVDAYNLSWNWDENSHAHRLNDKELQGLLIAIKESSKQLQSEVVEDSGLSSSTRSDIEALFGALERDADELRMRIKDSDPGAGEVTQLLDDEKALREILDQMNLNVKASRGWVNLKEMFANLAAAYRVGN